MLDSACPRSRVKAHLRQVRQGTQLTVVKRFGHQLERPHVARDLDQVIEIGAVPAFRAGMNAERGAVIRWRKNRTHDMKRRGSLPVVIEKRIVVCEAATTHELNNRFDARLTD